MSCVKCNSCNIVIDELLSYIQNKISISDEESLVKICSSFFTTEQIENSNILLFQAVPSELKRKIRKGKGKENRELYDIISFFKATDQDVLPIFVARDLEKLPPITFDHLDVSKLLKDLVRVQTEIESLKSSCVTINQFEDFKNEFLKVKERSPPFSAVKVNMKRGAYCNSGPMGLSHLDESLLQSYENKTCDEIISNENCLQYRSINIKNLEGISKTAPIQNQTGDDRGKTDCESERQVTKRNESPLSLAPDVNKRSEVLTLNENSSAVENVSYVDVIKSSEWKTVEKRKRKISRNRVEGKTGTVLIDAEEKFRAAEKKIPLFITNVHKDTRDSDIVDYINKKTNEIVTLEKISIKRHCEHNAYKFFVSQNKLPLYLDEKLWPQGIIFRRFINFKIKRNVTPTSGSGPPI
ncbi:uncharacterized protein LOC114352344 [Ostrinia furnacalis]|uniref:uncharacterized protein LOC114352344 n=1 Tax=Ostrinia furnacalis TaxID=93504 RepID=UPI00103E47E5|nr:uncharacterized protein LOC114352344 [Ostrinia furnacalis]